MPKKLGGLGLSSLNKCHQECLTKLAARVVLNPSSLWVRLVTDKYHFQGTWDSYSAPHNCSPIWGRICSYGSKIRFQFQWLIGNGRLIHVCRDPWISNIPTHRWPTFINIDIVADGLVVSDLITSSGGWNDDYIATIFPAEMMTTIHCVPLPQGGWPDLLVWHHSK